MTASVIRKQVRLPVSVAFGVVMQGIRIRLGRSIVTLMGVMLGIAFLMSILTGQTVRQGVGRETAARIELGRMMSFLTAEIGPVSERTLGVVAVGPLNDPERRLVARLRELGAAGLQWSGAVPAEYPAGWIKPVAAGEVGVGTAAVLVMGEGRVPGLDWGTVMTNAAEKVVATTRKALAVPAAGGMAVTSLEREWQPDEVEARELGARRLAFRTIWIIVISLLVTVIGIANAMLMSVTERFREIGTMKCLGALSAFIRQVFFIEASLLGVTGSVVGCLVGYGFAVLAYSLTYGFDLVGAALSMPQMAMHMLLCTVAGVVLSVVAAIYPAGVASRMMPADALRSTV